MFRFVDARVESLCFNYHIPQPNQPTRTIPRRSKMPTAADIAAAKNALKEKMLKEMEALDRAEEEQKRKRKRRRRQLGSVGGCGGREEEAEGDRGVQPKGARDTRRAQEEGRGEETSGGGEEGGGGEESGGEETGRADSVGVTVGAMLVEGGVTWM
jgi:hypothetical protein